MQEGEPFQTLLLRDADRTQTCNLLIRSQMLYSIKLRRLSFIASANVIYSAISAGCIGSPAGGCVGCPAGFLCPCRGPDEKRSGNTPRRSESSVKAVRGAPGDRPRAFRNIRDTLRSVRFGIFGTHSCRVVRDVRRLSGRGVRVRPVRSVRSLTVRTQTGPLRAAVT